MPVRKFAHEQIFKDDLILRYNNPMLQLKMCSLIEPWESVISDHLMKLVRSMLPLTHGGIPLR